MYLFDEVELLITRTTMMEVQKANQLVTQLPDRWSTEKLHLILYSLDCREPLFSQPIGSWTLLENVIVVCYTAALRG